LKQRNARPVLRRNRCAAAFYVLDGRGHRDVEREDYRILAEPQFRRFEAWADALDPGETPFLFVVSAVPVLHAKAALVDADLRFPLRQAIAGFGPADFARCTCKVSISLQLIKIK